MKQFPYYFCDQAQKDAIILVWIFWYTLCTTGLESTLSSSWDTADA